MGRKQDETPWTDKLIRGWITRKEYFDMRTAGDGLCMTFREGFAAPVWKLRYRIGGKQRVMTLGSYRDISLAEARKEAKRLRREVENGIDVGAAKQERIRAAAQAQAAREREWTVDRLADEYLSRMVDGVVMKPERPHRQLAKDVRPRLGKLLVKDVTPMDVDTLLVAIRDRGAPTTANDVLRLMQRMFDYAVTRHVIPHNPASAFGLKDAGGKEKSRTRALSRPEITRLFEAMRQTQSLGPMNYHTIKLLLLLAVRKQELTTARVSEFDLEEGLWRLPATRGKTKTAITIPLSASAVASIKELIRLNCSSSYLLPARKSQEGMLPHIAPCTLNIAMSAVMANLPDLEPFTIHDLRRTARTQLAALGIKPHISERCLNHKLRGVEGVYDVHDYLPERRAALALLAEVIDACEAGREWSPATSNVVPIRA